MITKHNERTNYWTEKTSCLHTKCTVSSDEKSKISKKVPFSLHIQVNHFHSKLILNDIWIYDRHLLQKSFLDFCLFSCSSLFLPWRVTPFPFIFLDFSFTLPVEYNYFKQWASCLYMYFGLSKVRNNANFFHVSQDFVQQHPSTYVRAKNWDCKQRLLSFSLARLLFLLEASGCW